MNPRVWILSVGFVLLGLGCSTFDRDWNATTNTTGIEGRWVGGWHRGTMEAYSEEKWGVRCLITRKEGSIYSTRFKFAPAMIGYGYGLDMSVTEASGQYQFQGQADFGKWAGGLHRYTGSGTTNQLQIDYSSGGGWFTFKLHRQKEGE